MLEIQSLVALPYFVNFSNPQQVRTIFTEQSLGCLNTRASKD